MAQQGKRVPDSVRQQYLDWLLTPPADRSPATKTEMAELLGVERKTLYNWEDSEEFQLALTQAKAKWSVRFESDVLNRLIRIIHEGTDRDAIAASRVLLGHITTDDKGNSSQGLSAEQRAALRRELEEAGFTVSDSE